ncbi:MAG TPA: metalloregulator ArsR/SmtB family transcription factor [Candidatus Kryptonia bacterium]|nr:metalloregulator ArsR/SmtB family transcription factor [Candidatus Kryptonia bacterium]
MRLDREAPARDKVLFLLKSRGPQTSRQIARRLGISGVAVRQHLRRLEDEGFVESTEERRGIGRPARVFATTPAAEARFPNAHADLTVELIAAMRKAFGEAGLDKIVGERTRRQLRGYRERVGRRPSLEARVAALAQLRGEEGYMAAWSKAADGSYRLVENHCPICVAAKTCQGLCRDELKVFRAVLGPGVEVTRTEHLLAGARRCAYRVTRSN